MTVCDTLPAALEASMSSKAAFLSKPFTPHALAARIREVLDRDGIELLRRIRSASQVADVRTLLESTKQKTSSDIGTDAVWGATYRRSKNLEAAQ